VEYTGIVHNTSKGLENKKPRHRRYSRQSDCSWCCGMVKRLWNSWACSQDPPLLAKSENETELLCIQPSCRYFCSIAWSFLQWALVLLFPENGRFDVYASCYHSYSSVLRFSASVLLTPWSVTSSLQCIYDSSSNDYLSRSHKCAVS